MNNSGTDNKHRIFEDVSIEVPGRSRVFEVRERNASPRPLSKTVALIARR
jgi:hypothetical protein